MQLQSGSRENQGRCIQAAEKSNAIAPDNDELDLHDMRPQPQLGPELPATQRTPNQIYQEAITALYIPDQSERKHTATSLIKH